MAFWDNWKISKEDTDEIEQEIKNNLDSKQWKFTETNSNDENLKIGRNVYANDGSAKDFNTKFTFTHRLFKYSMLLPAMELFRKKYRKNMLKEVPDKPEYDKLKMLDVAFERALQSWCTYYLGKYENGAVRDHTIDYKTDLACERLRFLKEAYITVLANDTAYLEFHNMLMYELAKEFHNLEPHHQLYVNTNINDVKYFLPVDRFTPETRQLARHLVDGYIRYAEVKKKEDGNIELVIWDEKMPSFVKNTDLPKE
jgi:hypothetical protein